MQVPAARRRRIWPNSHSTSRSTREEVGSSRNSMRGAWLTARTISTVWRSASEISSIERARIDMPHPETFQERIRLAQGRGPADQPGFALRLAQEQQVFGDRHPGQQGQFLKDRPGAEIMRRLRAGEGDLAARRSA